MSRELPPRDLNNNQPRAIAHALAVLEEIAASGSGVTARDIAAHLSLSPATTYRILNLLVREEYVVRLGDLSGFALGARIGVLAESQPAIGVTRAVSGLVDELRHSLGVAVHLFSVFGTRIRLLDEDPRFPLEERTHVMSDLHASAAGCFILADAGAGDAVDGDGLEARFDHLGHALIVVHNGPTGRRVSSIASGVRDADETLVNILMASASRDYISIHREQISHSLLIASRDLAPLLS